LTFTTAILSAVEEDIASLHEIGLLFCEGYRADRGRERSLRSQWIYLRPTPYRSGDEHYAEYDARKKKQGRSCPKKHEQNQENIAGLKTCTIYRMC